MNHYKVVKSSSLQHLERVTKAREKSAPMTCLLPVQLDVLCTVAKSWPGIRFALPEVQQIVRHFRARYTVSQQLIISIVSLHLSAHTSYISGRLVYLTYLRVTFTPFIFMKSSHTTATCPAWPRPGATTVYSLRHFRGAMTKK